MSSSFIPDFHKINQCYIFFNYTVLYAKIQDFSYRGFITLRCIFVSLKRMRNNVFQNMLPPLSFLYKASCSTGAPWNPPKNYYTMMFNFTVKRITTVILTARTICCCIVLNCHNTPLTPKSFGPTQHHKVF